MANRYTLIVNGQRHRIELPPADEDDPRPTFDRLMEVHEVLAECPALATFTREGEAT